MQARSANTAITLAISVSKPTFRLLRGLEGNLKPVVLTVDCNAWHCISVL